MARGKAEKFKALGVESRIRIIELLKERGALSVNDIADVLGITASAVSQHLKVLLASGLVTRRKAGRFRYYRANPGALREVRDWTEQYRRSWEARLDRLADQLARKA